MQQLIRTDIGPYFVATYQHQGKYQVVGFKKVAGEYTGLTYRGKPLAFEAVDLDAANEAHATIADAVRRAAIGAGEVPA